MLTLDFICTPKGHVSPICDPWVRKSHQLLLKRLNPPLSSCFWKTLLRLHQSLKLGLGPGWLWTKIDKWKVDFDDFELRNNPRLALNILMWGRSQKGEQKRPHSLEFQKCHQIFLFLVLHKIKASNTKI